MINVSALPTWTHSEKNARQGVASRAQRAKNIRSAEIQFREYVQGGACRMTFEIEVFSCAFLPFIAMKTFHPIALNALPTWTHP